MHEVRADTAGNVWKVLVKEGDAVVAGETLVVLESMKMEIPVDAPADGTIREIHVMEDTPIGEGDLIAVIA